MITIFGKLCRKLRIDKGELLKDMADKLGVTSAYLSAVEVGKRNVPQDWPQIIAKIYSLESFEYDDLIEAAEMSKQQIKIDLREYDNNDRELMLAFARNFSGLEEEKKIKIKDLLFNKKA